MNRVVSFATRQNTKLFGSPSIEKRFTYLAASITSDTTTSIMSSSKSKRGIIMVLSPAKTLDLSPLSERKLSVDPISVSYGISQSKNDGTYKPGELCNEERTKSICKVMKKKTGSQLKSLLGLSDALSKTALGYWTDFNADEYTKQSSELNDNFKPAIYTFSGPAFKGLDPQTCTSSTLSYMASHLFILDPVYGVLQSLQSIQPYRLEMGVKLIGDEKLSNYWKDSVTTYLGKELVKNTPAGKEDKGRSNIDGPILANLASDEYSSSIDPALLPPNSIFLNVVFRHKGRVLAVHAKRARGLMARYISENECSTLDDVSKFDWENYASDGEIYEVEKVVGDNVQIMKMIFNRDDAPPKAAAAAASTKKRAASGDKKKPAASKKTKK